MIKNSTKTNLVLHQYWLHQPNQAVDELILIRLDSDHVSTEDEPPAWGQNHACSHHQGQSSLRKRITLVDMSLRTSRDRCSFYASSVYNSQIKSVVPIKLNWNWWCLEIWAIRELTFGYTAVICTWLSSSHVYLAIQQSCVLGYTAVMCTWLYSIHVYLAIQQSCVFGNTAVIYTWLYSSHVYLHGYTAVMCTWLYSSHLYLAIKQSCVLGYTAVMQEHQYSAT